MEHQKTLQIPDEWPDNWPDSACQFADVSNERIDELLVEVKRLRVAMACAAQAAADWPDGDMIDPADVLAKIAEQLESALDA